MSAELLELGTRPITADAPAGASARDAAEFEALQLEMRKLELADKPTVDWDRAVREASALLGGRSKDLLVACYLCGALLERDGYPGLATGLQVIRDLVGNYWETLFPEVKRMRGRAAAFEWLNERGAASVRRRGGRGQRAENLQPILDRLNELHEQMTPLMEGGYAVLSELRSALADAISEAAPPAGAELPAGGAGEAAGGPVVAAGPSLMTSVGSPEDLERAMGQAREVLAGVSAYLRQSDPGNPLIHRLPRFLLWAEIQQLPPDEDGVTAIIQPAAEVREGLEALAAAGDWDALLDRTDEVFMSGALWLDLQRWAWEALTGKGEGFEAAAEGVALETGALVRRFPDLLRLRFDGGEPLADDATRAWIQARALGGGGAIEVATAPTLGGRVRGGEGFEEAVQEARRLARSKKLGEALALLERGALGAGRLDDRIAWKLEVARACIAGEYHDLALAQLEAIEQELARSTVEQWDPELCADLLRQMLLARRRIWERVEPSAEEAARTRELMARLTRLDLRAALELHGRG